MTVFEKIKYDISSLKYNLAPYIFLLFISVACKEKVVEKEAVTIASGADLMQTHCTSCHLLPMPENLDQFTWKESVLPRMAYMLGIRNQPDSAIVAFNDFDDGAEIAQKSSPYLIHKTPSVTNVEWKKIESYILKLAPKKLPNGELKIVANSNVFVAKKIKLPFARPAISLTAFSDSGGLLVGDSNNGGSLLQLNSDFQLVKKDATGKHAIHAQKVQDSYWLTHMGDTFSATDNSNGYIAELTNKGAYKKIIENLKRPVHVAYGDLMGDENTEMIVSEFGKWTGELSLLYKKDDTYEKKSLVALPGAIRSEIIDLNKDGKQDIVALFGQGEESIRVLYNLGNGEFKTETVLQFPPTYGSTYFTLKDFNADGHLDIIYTCGDNGDYAPIAKPYHGIRVYLNDGKNEFSEKLFLPQYGVFKTIAEDFDADGDIDFATISYFPKYKKEYFVFRENIGDGWFLPQLIKNIDVPSIMTMDAIDFDKDGDIDIVLGAFEWEQNSNSATNVDALVYLENKTK